MTGYVIDTTYTDTFFRELSPAWLNYVAAVNGMAPRPLDRAFTYLELGCGFGTSAVVNAAAYPQASIHACDFNGAHIDGGRRYATRLGVENIQFHTAAFETLLTFDLPSFDFIVLHGVYSWVDGQTRRQIRQIIARFLKRGGIVYVSYNALPGWAHELPLRKMLVELAATIEGTAAERSAQAARVLESLSVAGLRYFTANPAAKSAVEAYQRGEGQYLAHEFMNAAWEPFYAVDVADELATIGLLPAGSATLAHNHLPLIADTSAARAIAALPTARQQQLALDFAANQRFRRDVFVYPDDSPSHGGYLEDAVIGCARDVGDISVTIRVPRGEIRFNEPFIDDVRTLMGSRSCAFGDAVAALGGRGQDKAGIARNLLFLVAGGVLAPFARPAVVAATAPTTMANRMVEQAVADASAADGHAVVPSVIYGNGIEISAADARALLDWSRGGAVAPQFIERRLPTFARLGVVA